MSNLNDQNWQLPKFTVEEFRKRKTKYCLCIPVINEGERIRKQLFKTKKYAKLIDILILDGGSTDDSLDKSFLKEMAVRTLLTKTSPGRQSTQLRMGFSYALREGYEGIITIDGNGKDGVEAIPAFIKQLDRGFDYIQGSRFMKGGKAINTPPLRWLGIRFLISPFLSIASGYWFSDITNGFRAYSKRVLLSPKVKLFRDLFIKYELLFYLPVKAAQLGFKVTELPVSRAYPKHEIPTKIKSVTGHLDFLVTVIKTAFGTYNP
ncbi:glycosyltransferase family 2 protein [Candidatus Daviesbacteria bacterium]|nr:glycosyltransferase family 2 protein [Candidatus Daviesbacteria bacterium]